MIDLREVRDRQEIAQVTALVWEFFDYLRDRYPEHAQVITDYLTAQDVTGELALFDPLFTRPAGVCLLALLDGEPVGTVMLKRNDDRTCELNRMWVRPAARGHGIARALCLRLLDIARDMGFAEIRLEALNDRIEALPLYRQLGFATDQDPTAFAQPSGHVVSLRRPL